MIRPLNQDRSYITRLRFDPRIRAMFDGWVAQATMEAEQRFPDPRDDRARSHFAAETALRIGLAFVLDNDGEYQRVLAENEKLMKRLLDAAHLPPLHVVLPSADEQEKPA